MSVATATTPIMATAPSPSRASQLATPTHSILRPCNNKGIPVGPPVITTAGAGVSIAPQPASATIATPTSTLSTKPTLTVGTNGLAPASPTASNHPMSSSDSLTAPSLSTGISSSTSVSATSASSTAYSDVFESESVAESSNGASTPRSSMISPSPKIRFGNCPERPPELRRRNSITLGVLARKNMLHAQGTIPANRSASGTGGMNKVYMTDAEWEAYQQKFAKPHQTPAVDLGAVMSSGAKSFWRKVRRGSNASVASNASVSSTVSTTPSAPAPRGRSDSAPTGANPGPISPRVGPVDVAPAIVEEDEPHSAPGSPRVGALHLSSLDGDATPGRRRSPSPPPQLGESAFDDDAYSDSPVSTTSRMSGENGEQHERERDDDDHIRDDADAEHDSHRASSTAALGFEIRNYNKRPTWGRRGSGSGSRPSSLLAAEPPE